MFNGRVRTGVAGQSGRGVEGVDPRRVIDRAALRTDDEDRLRNRALLLKPEDRALVEGLYGKGMTTLEMARLLNVSQETVRRRGRKLLRHLRSPLFSFVLAQRAGWEATRRKVAETRFLQRRSLRDAAVKADLTMHQVRTQSTAILAQFEALAP